MKREQISVCAGANAAAYSQRTNEPPRGIVWLDHPTHRACPFCGQVERRSMMRNNRCRECRKAQP